MAQARVDGVKALLHDTRLCAYFKMATTDKGQTFQICCFRIIFSDLYQNKQVCTSLDENKVFVVLTMCLCGVNIIFSLKGLYNIVQVKKNIDFIFKLSACVHAALNKTQCLSVNFKVSLQFQNFDVVSSLTVTVIIEMS